MEINFQLLDCDYILADGVVVRLFDDFFRTT